MVDHKGRPRLEFGRIIKGVVIDCAVQTSAVPFVVGFLSVVYSLQVSDQLRNLVSSTRAESGDTILNFNLILVPASFSLDLAQVIVRSFQ